MTTQRGWTPDVELDRRLSDWLDENAAQRAPVSLETAFIEGVARERPRPAWATTGRWISMETRAYLGGVPRAVALLLVFALLTAIALGSIALGSSLIAPGERPITFARAGGLWIADPGEDPRPLVSDEFSYGAPVWSNDGTRLSAERSVGDGPREIVVVDAATRSVVPVTDAVDWEPGWHAWSPDDTTIIFEAGVIEDERPVCNADGAYCGHRIVAVQPGGSGYSILGAPDIDARSPIWSHDGETIYFGGSHVDEPTRVQLYRMDADGSDVRPVSDAWGNGFSFWRLDLSPDGKHIVTQLGIGTTDIWVIDLATGEATQLTESSRSDWDASWSPEGDRIVFSRMGEAVRLLTRQEDGSFEESLISTGLSRPRFAPDGASLLAHGPGDSLVQVDLSDDEITQEDIVPLDDGEETWDFDW